MSSRVESPSKLTLVYDDDEVREFHDVPRRQEDEAVVERYLLEETNTLLEAMDFGEKTFGNYQDLITSASSMFVAIYEKLFQKRLETIIRTPSSSADYANNAQVVIDAISDVVNESRLRRVSGEDISAGKVKSIRYLVRIFMEVLEIKLEEENKNTKNKKKKPTSVKKRPTGTSASVLPISTKKTASVKKKPAKQLGEKTRVQQLQKSIGFGSSISSVSEAESECDPVVPEEMLQNLSISGEEARKTPAGKELKTGTEAVASEKSKNQLRYKLALKEHLRDLRQREMRKRKQLKKEMNSDQYTEQVAKIRSARLHHDLRMQRISIGLQQQNQEEQNLKAVMNYLLHLEHERLQEEHRRTDEILRQIHREHKEKETAIESFYADQMSMIKDQVYEENRDRAVREQAHRQASHQLLKELRNERERQMLETIQQRKHLLEFKLVNESKKIESLKKKSSTKTMLFKPSSTKTGVLHAAALEARQKRLQRERELRNIYGPSA